MTTKIKRPACATPVWRKEGTVPLKLLWLVPRVSGIGCRRDVIVVRFLVACVFKMYVLKAPQGSVAENRKSS